LLKKRICSHGTASIVLQGIPGTGSMTACPTPPPMQCYVKVINKSETIMGKEKTLFKSEEKRDRTSIAAFLRHLADKLEANEVVLKQGDQKLKLDIPDYLELEVEVEKEISKKKTEMELEIELKWDVKGKNGKKTGGPLTLG